MPEIIYLTKENASFKQTNGGMLAVQIEDQEHDAVFLHCSFPHTDKSVYISVRTADHKEVGMIKTLEDFSDETKVLLEQHIALRYFAPQITKVINITDEFGYSYWEAETDAGDYRFTVRRGGANVKLVTDEKLMITDVDGNRFIIEDLSKVSEKEFRMIEMCM